MFTTSDLANASRRGHEHSPTSKWEERVTDPRQLAASFQVVEAFYQKRLNVCIKGVVRASDVCLDDSLATGVTGLAQWVLTLPGERISDVRIRLRPGSSVLNTTAVLTHEVFHLMSASWRLCLPNQLEEGAANLAQYLFLKHHGGFESQELQWCLHVDDNEVYGDGFRIARQTYRQQGSFARCLASLKVRAVNA